jgi:peptidoglycan hydrolase CwlO-like protein
MSIQAISLILFNGVSTAIFFNYAIKYIYNRVSKDKDEQILWLLAKINKLENEVNELHETIDTLEEKIQAKENLLKESSDMLFNKIDNFIISNYDTIQKEEQV